MSNPSPLPFKLGGAFNATGEGLAKLGGGMKKLTEGLAEVGKEGGMMGKIGQGTMGGLDRLKDVTQNVTSKAATGLVAATVQMTDAVGSGMKQTVQMTGAVLPPQLQIGERPPFVPPPELNLVGYIREYLRKLIAAVDGMKVLLLDKETAKIVSLVYSQTEILSSEVYLVDRLDKDGRDQLPHLKAVCFLRPTGENMALLRRELRNPCYGEYFLNFTNVIRDTFLQETAEADEKEAIKSVHEMYGDYSALDQYSFLLPVAKNHVCLQPSNWSLRDSQLYGDRIVEGLGALLLCLKRRPIVRYQRGSEFSRRVADDLHRLTHESEKALFDFGSKAGESPPVVLVLDRKDDPVTPLLMQWTYQAMIHELIGIVENRVDLKGRPKVHEDMQEVVLSPHQDEFFAKNMMANFGEIGIAIKGLVDEFSANHSKHTPGGIQTIEEMQQFIENYPEFRAKQGKVSKHVTLLSEMSSAVDEQNLMTISEVEQDLSSNMSGVNTSIQQHFETVQAHLEDPKTSKDGKLKLVLLFALRYESHEMGGRMISELMTKLESGENPLPKSRVNLVTTLLRWMGSDKRAGDLYGNRDFLGKTTAIFKGLKGVENVYTQHQPLLQATLEALVKQRLKEGDYPYAGSQYSSSYQQAPGQPRPQTILRDVVVFIAGGATYEEIKVIHQLNAQARKGEGWPSGMRFMIGSTAVLSTGQFLRDLQEMQAAEAEHTSR